MKFSLINNPNKFANVTVTSYAIDWNAKEASSYEDKVKAFLYPYWKLDLVLTQFRIPGSKYRLDFFNVSKGIVIEVSPSCTHAKFNKFMHGTIHGNKPKQKDL